MENLNKHTAIELQKIVNDLNNKHEKLREEIISDTYQLEILDKKINNNIEELNIIEKKYIEVIEEMNKRDVL